MTALSKHQEGMIAARPDEEQLLGIEIASVMHQSIQGGMSRHIREEIHELKEQLQEKDSELEKLRKKVKDLEDKNNNLSIKLEAKDDEVKSLKERIKTLEDEKKHLEQELASVQFKLKAVEDDVKKITKSQESDEEKYVKLEEKFKKIQYTLDGVVEDLETTKNENKKLNHELKQVRHQSRYVAGVPSELLPLPATEDSKALTSLGEMCLQIQAKLYKKTLPNHFTPIRSYKISTLKKDIKKLCKTEEEKRQALERWEDLKATLPLKEEEEEELEEALDALQDGYKRCHDTKLPELSEKLLKKSAEVLERLNILKGWISLERVNGLIDIWKRLVVCGEN